MRALLLAKLLTVALFALPAAAGEHLRLMMFEQDWCEYCEQWNAEVGVIYDRTPEGAKAPLWRVDIFDPVPEGVTLSRGTQFTPTFVLLRDGVEISRIEGYPGEDFFWGMLDGMLKRANAKTTDG